MVAAVLPPVTPPHTGLRPSVADGAHPSKAFLAPRSTPRHVLIRSRVLMTRTAHGATCAMVPPLDFSSGSFGGSSSSTSTGSERTPRLPIQLVPMLTSGNRQILKTEPLRGKVFAEMGNMGGTNASTCNSAPMMERAQLTPEMHAEVKDKLDILSSHSRTGGFIKHPRKLVLFLDGLQSMCDFMEKPLADKMYRHQYDHATLHFFLRLVPQLNSIAEIPQISDSLPVSGFLPVTVQLSLAEVAWQFKYNSLTHRICNCKEICPGVGRCLVPAEGSPGAKQSAKCEIGDAAFAGGEKRLEKQGDALRRLERHFPPMLVDLANSVRERFHELVRQVPAKLGEFLRLPIPTPSQTWERFVCSFVSQVSIFDRYYVRFEQLYLELIHRMIISALEPVRGMTEPSTRLVRAPGDPFRPVQIAVLCQRLGLLKQQVDFGGVHNLTVFDPSLLMKAQRVIQISTFKEVRNMALAMISKFETLCRVLNDLQDCQIQPELCENMQLRDAVLQLESIWVECQHVLNQSSLDFIHELLKYMPRLDDTFRHKLRIAITGITRQAAQQAQQNHERGKGALQTSGHGHGHNVNVASHGGTNIGNPGSGHNLRPTGGAGADGHNGRHASAPPTSRALSQTPAGAAHHPETEEAAAREHKRLEREAAEFIDAKRALFETLPILMYLDELWRDINQDRDHSGPRATFYSNFRELFCPSNDKYNSLRADLRKFDEQRFAKLHSFVLGEDDDEEGGNQKDQRRYFHNVFRQLKEASAFKGDGSLQEQLRRLELEPARDEEAKRERLEERREVERLWAIRSQWVCMHKIAQTVEPELFCLASERTAASKVRSLQSPQSGTQSGAVVSHDTSVSEGNPQAQVSDENAEKKDLTAA